MQLEQIQTELDLLFKDTFERKGEILTLVRDKKLYKHNFNSFAEFVAQWGLSRQDAFRYIAGYATFKILKANFPPNQLQTSDHHFRVLNKYSEADKIAIYTQALSYGVVPPSREELKQAIAYLVEQEKLSYEKKKYSRY